MPNFTYEMEFDVSCSKCGAPVQMMSGGRIGDLEVAPCQDCIDKARVEGAQTEQLGLEEFEVATINAVIKDVTDIINSIYPGGGQHDLREKLFEYHQKINS